MQLFQEQGFFPSGKKQIHKLHSMCVNEEFLDLISAYKNLFVFVFFVYSSGHCSLPDKILRYISHQGVSAAEDQGGPAEDHADGCSC